MHDELPDTDDPFVLLGVTPEDDARTRKRAYVRLIKRFRPERDPDAFKRIHAAYEAVRDAQRAAGPKGHHDSRGAYWREQRTNQTSDSADTAEQDASPLPAKHESHESPQQLQPTHATAQPQPPRDDTPAPTPVSPQVAIATYLQAENFGQAQALLRSVDDTAKSEPWYYVFSALAATGAAGAPTAGLPYWATALRAGVPISEALWRNVDDTCLSALYAQGLLDWSVLRHQPDGGGTGALFHAFVERALLAGRVQELLSLVTSADFRKQQLSHPAIIPALWRIAAYGCFERPEQARAIMAAYPPSPQDWDDELDAFDENLPLTVALAQAVSAHGLRPELDRLFRYGGLGDRCAEPLIRKAAEAIMQNPSAALTALDHIEKTAPELLERTLSICDRLSPSEDALWDELTDAEQQRVDSVMTSVDAVLNRNLINSLHTSSVIVGFFGLIAAFVVWGWWGLLVLLSGVIYLAVSTRYLDAWLYPNKVRPFLATRLGESGVSPARMAEWFVNLSKSSDNVGRFDGEIESDTVIELVAALGRVRLQHQSSVEQPQDVSGHVATATVPTTPVVARADHCAAHPTAPATAHCRACRRAACDQCDRGDREEGYYCPQCEHAQQEARRRVRLEAEASCRAIACIPACYAGLFAAAAAITAGHAGALVLLALSGTSLAVTLGILALRSWAPIAYLPFGLGVMLGFPVGTAFGGLSIYTLFKSSGRRMFKAEQRKLIAATPGHDTLPRKRLWAIASATLLGTITVLLSKG